MSQMPPRELAQKMKDILAAQIAEAEAEFQKCEPQHKYFYHGVIKGLKRLQASYQMVERSGPAPPMGSPSRMN